MCCAWRRETPGAFDGRGLYELVKHFVRSDSGDEFRGAVRGGSWDLERVAVLERSCGGRYGNGEYWRNGYLDDDFDFDCWRPLVALEEKVMDLVSQIVGGIARANLPQGSTLEACPVNEGRLDVLVSHGLSYIVAQAGNPVLAAVYQAARPFLDGALVGAIGPAAGSAPKKVAKKRTTAVEKRRKREEKRGREYTKDGVEILDAEFVDMPAGGVK